MSWIIPYYENPKYIVALGMSGIDVVRHQSDKGFVAECGEA